MYDKQEQTGPSQVMVIDVEECTHRILVIRCDRGSTSLPIYEDRASKWTIVNADPRIGVTSPKSFYMDFDISRKFG